MGIEIRLTDQHLPVSPILIDFLYRHLIKSGRKIRWHDQLNENLNNEAQAIRELADEKMPEVMQNPVAQQTINRSYDLLMTLLFGVTERLKPIHNNMNFILVVGCPRSGGSYLTKHLFQALGKSVEEVPSVIGHDGFPDPVPFTMQDRNNAHTTLTRHMAEYMAMAELFFANTPRYTGKIIVPKKATKAAYYGAFFNAALGEHTELIITLRHPTASCISTYEKSGGLPRKGKFEVRSNIESWVERDIRFLTGNKPSSEDDYFNCYLQYWENFHNALVLSGLLANPNRIYVPYSRDEMMHTAKGFYDRFNSSVEVDEFKVVEREAPDSAWREKGDRAVARVATLWKSFGHQFPTEEIMNNF